MDESDLSKSDTLLSFGETHASELSSINSEVSSLSAAANATPLSSTMPLPPSGSPPSLSPPIDVATLNHSPAPVPLSAAVAVPNPTDPAQTLPAVTPTIAETGIPLSSGDSKPGPSSGSLLDIGGQRLAPSVTPVVEAQKYESAEEEKKRLAAAYSQQVSTEAAPPAKEPSQAVATAAVPESAEEEKKRLEREERERILRGDQNTSSSVQGEDPPAYEEPK